MTKLELKKSKTILWTITIIVFLALVSLIIFKQEGVKVVFQEESPLSGRAASFIADTPPVLLSDDYILGSTKAPIKVVVYEDYASQFSADNADNLDKVRSEFGKSVAVIVRPFAVRGNTDSLILAMAVRCAGEQGEWEKMRIRIFELLREDKITEQSLMTTAQELKINQEDFISCLTDIEKQGIILQETAAAKTNSVYGAPTLFINDDIIVGARPYEDYIDSDGKEVEGLKTIVSQYLQ
ncbi:hypothetical protein EOL72_01770 [Candidatus Falkowbacteria bacterium]|nr:thioredoxin domain-containing protein [Patescibacteria group bacterium]MDD3435352.1 thioredoxin domain-containing protein [Patescibacteria group bacterium]NCU43061.1 hypothetical protein [Candidatus Falkowbacteria bacterium]